MVINLYDYLFFKMNEDSVRAWIQFPVRSDPERVFLYLYTLNMSKKSRQIFVPHYINMYMTSWMYTILLYDKI